MAKKSIGTDTRELPLALQISREEARVKISDRISKGNNLKALLGQVSSHDAFKNVQKDYSTWTEFNAELLKQIFTNEGAFKQYQNNIYFGSLGEQTLAQEVSELENDIARDTRKLESFVERLEIIPVHGDVGMAGTVRSVAPQNKNRKVFVVHGHDDSAREATARFLEKLNLEAIVLHEQANKGKTIIEKLEHYADVDFAIVLLTPDDVGASVSDSSNLQKRARQNVIFELGFFISHLGRNRVCALLKHDVEKPSDFSGIIYIPIDSSDGWKYKVGKELQASGFDVDLNKI